MLPVGRAAMASKQARARFQWGGPGQGDPFLGGVVRAIGGKLLKKAGSWIGRRVGATARGIQRKVGILPPVGPVGQAVIGGIAAGTAGGIVGKVLGPRARGERRYRRMNVANIRALKRAIRRTEGFRKVALSCIRLKSQVRMPRKKKRC